ncbi:MAG: sulfatase [Pirellulales bacterium]|nr:sulfatase [Pirellulales bacterium]
MSRSVMRWWLSGIVMGAVWTLAPHAGAADQPDVRPNIVFILVDDLGWADLGFSGADLHETPRLDRLATASKWFTCAYASAPVCTPTRAAIMTGKHPARLHMTIWREAIGDQERDRRLLPPEPEADLPLREVTLAEALGGAGYVTAHVGKWHLGSVTHFPEVQGFDIHLAGNHWGAPATHFFPYRGPGFGERRYVPGLPWGHEGEYLADRLTDEAIEIIRRAKDRPFFLNLWHYGVHTPIQAKADDVAHFQGRVRPELHHRNATYAAMVKNLDDNVGRLLDCLDELGLSERTIVVFSSDNGGYINAPAKQPKQPVTNNFPLRSGKGSLYEGGIRVPLLVRWPARIAPGRDATPVASADLYRTLLDLTDTPAKLDEAQQADAVSLAPLLTAAADKLPERTLYWHYPHYYPTSTPASAVREGNWKLIEYFEDQRTELYNLAEDEAEQHDLAGAQPQRAAELRARLSAWREGVAAQTPRPNPGFKSPSP